MLDCLGSPVMGFMALNELALMQDGLEIQPWNQPDAGPLVLAVLALLGLWVLLAGFPREGRRWAWAWSKPRNLMTRNASETPRTLGVVLSHGLALLGVMAGLHTLLPEDTQAPSWWTVVGGLAGIGALRWAGARLALGPNDMSSTLVEMGRHNHTWIGVALAAWALVAALNPTVHASPVAGWGAAVVYGLASMHASLRSSQLIQGSNQHRVVGILYLCTLEWGWSLFWTLWSIRAALRGH